MKISAVIISKNEENKIEDCLKSLKGVADEIILIDSGSADKTLSIAKKYTDKIIHKDFHGFVEQKNYAISKTSFDWVLNLDCDERLSSTLRDSILAIKNNLNDYDAYKFARRTFYINRWLKHCWYPDYKIRLFNKNKSKFEGIKLHEYIEVNSNKIKIINGDILHYSFDSISDHLKTIDKFTEIAAHEVIEKKKKVTIFTAISHAIWIFIKLYFVKAGFLDGMAGFIVAALSTVHVFVKYVKVIILKNSLKNSNVKA